MNNRFGTLVKQYIRREAITQRQLASEIHQDPSVITRMLNGDRLSGESARVRVIEIIKQLHSWQLIHTLQEANELLEAASMLPLTETEQTVEGQKLIRALQVSHTKNTAQLDNQEQLKKITVGQLIRQHREKRGMSRWALLYKIDTALDETDFGFKSEAWLSRIERGEIKRPPRSEIIAIAQGLGLNYIDTAYLLAAADYNTLTIPEETPHLEGFTTALIEICASAIEVVKTMKPEPTQDLKHEDWKSLARSILSTVSQSPRRNPRSSTPPLLEILDSSMNLNRTEHT